MRRPLDLAVVVLISIVLAAAPVSGQGGAEVDYSDLVRASRPLAYWRLGESSGARAGSDGSVEGADASYSGGVEFRQAGLIFGDADGAVGFNGVDAEVRIPSLPEINTEGPYVARSIELWFRAEAIGQPQVLYEEGGDERGLSLVVQRAGGESRLFMMGWNLRDDVWQPLVLNSVVTEDEIHHAVLVFDASADDRFGDFDGRITGYLDGVSIGTLTGADRLWTHVNEVAIGGVAGGTPEFPGTLLPNLTPLRDGANFLGVIDEVALYDYPLDDPDDDGDRSDSRVRSHFEAGDSRDCNENGVNDALDILRGTSPDNDRDGVPDECESSVELNVSEIRESTCAGDEVRHTLTVQLESRPRDCQGPGVRGWSFGISAAPCRLVAATTSGTAADAPPMGFFSNGFEQTELTSGPGNQGAVTTVVLSLEDPVTLPHCETFDVLEIAIETALGDDCQACALRLVDGLVGSGEPVSAIISVGDDSISPVRRERTVERCECSATVSIVPEQATRCVAVVLNSEFPFRGGELGIAHDPSRVTPTGVQPGADFPGGDADLFLQFDPAIQCAPESGVQAGLVVAWVNDGTGELMPPGEYELLRVCYEPSEGPGGGLCSPLRFVDCLGVEAAPVVNRLTIDSDTVFVETSDAELCGDEPVFRRGDPDSDGAFTVSDPILVLGCLFQGTACPNCPDAADANDDGDLNIVDALYLLNWRFLGGPAPELPFPGCGIDRTPDSLGACQFDC